MALTILYNDNKKDTFYLGSKMKGAFVPGILCVFADGDELGAILTQFRNLPVPSNDYNRDDPTARGYMVEWFGDHAKFIVANIKL